MPLPEPNITTSYHESFAAEYVVDPPVQIEARRYYAHEVDLAVGVIVTYARVAPGASWSRIVTLKRRIKLLSGEPGARLRHTREWEAELPDWLAPYVRDALGRLEGRIS